MSDTSYTDSARSCIVGSVAWLHKEWLESYYPEDLPEDWRLSFYANDFNGLLLKSADIIPGLMGDNFQDEVSDDFRIFVLQNDMPIAEIIQQSAVLSEHFGMILASDGQLYSALNQPLGQWRYSSAGLMDTNCLVLDNIDGKDLKYWRQQLETLQPLENGQRLIFCQHVKGDIELLNNIKMMTEMMGLA